MPRSDRLYKRRQFYVKREFQFNFIMSMVSRDLHDEIAWMSHCLSTYVLLPQGYSPKQLQAKFPDFVAAHYGPIFFKETGVDYLEHISHENNFWNSES